MKALARGKDEEVITSMIKHLINSSQGSQFETYLDDEAIRDIADVVQSDLELFTSEEASQLNISHAIQVKGGKEVLLDDDDDI